VTIAIRNSARTAVALIVAIGSGGCSDKSDRAAGATDAGLTAMDGASGSCNGAATPFVLPLSATTPKGEFEVTVTESEPPDFGMGDNAWTVRVEDSSGAPVVGSTFKVNPWMPKHKHGAVTLVVVTELGDGEYRAKPINVNMPGIWDIRFDFPGDAGTPLRAVFTLCSTAR
jgi:hypothetical protein